MWRKFPIRLALVALALAVPPAGPARAACPAPGSPSAERAKHALVCLGTVESWRDSTVASPGRAPRKIRLAIVRMQSIWKGVPRRQFTIASAAPGAPAPPWTFVKGETYVIYADSLALGWYADPCSRTAPSERAAEDLAALGTPVIVQRLPARKTPAPH